jgi:hypothetical protein
LRLAALAEVLRGAGADLAEQASSSPAGAFGLLVDDAGNVAAVAASGEELLAARGVALSSPVRRVPPTRQRARPRHGSAWHWSIGR